MNLTEKLKKLPRSKRKEAKELIGVFVLDSIYNDTSSAISPVTGKRFTPLSDKYKKVKKKITGKTIADLRLFEKMLPSLKVRNTTDGIKLEVTNKKEILKAYNHNTGDTLPQRQFLPDDGGESIEPTSGRGESQFRKSINDGIDSLIESMIDGD